MSEYVTRNQELETFSLGRTVLGILMGVGSIAGIWLLSGLLQVFIKITG
jgi:hypothetical protein